MSRMAIATAKAPATAVSESKSAPVAIVPEVNLGEYSKILRTFTKRVSVAATL